MCNCEWACCESWMQLPAISVGIFFDVAVKPVSSIETGTETEVACVGGKFFIRLLYHYLNRVTKTIFFRLFGFDRSFVLVVLVLRSVLVETFHANDYRGHFQFSVSSLWFFGFSDFLHIFKFSIFSLQGLAGKL